MNAGAECVTNPFYLDYCLPSRLQYTHVQCTHFLCFNFPPIDNNEQLVLHMLWTKYGAILLLLNLKDIKIVQGNEN